MTLKDLWNKTKKSVKKAFGGGGNSTSKKSKDKQKKPARKSGDKTEFKTRQTPRKKIVQQYNQAKKQQQINNKKEQTKKAVNKVTNTSKKVDLKKGNETARRTSPIAKVSNARGNAETNREKILNQYKGFKKRIEEDNKKSSEKREAYRESVRKETRERNTKKQDPISRVGKAEERDKKSLGMTGAGSKGATAEDRIKANMQAAKHVVNLYKKNGAVAGAVEGFNPFADRLDKMGVDGYINAQDQAKIEKKRETTSYKVGYAGGTMASFVVPGGVGGKVASKSMKAAKGGKQLAKNTLKKNAIQTAANTPINVTQAIKDNKDEGGSGRDLAKKITEYTAADIVIGGAMEGVGHILTKKQANAALELLKKKKAGNITEEETKKLDKLTKKLDKKEGKSLSDYKGKKGEEVENLRNEIKNIEQKAADEKAYKEATVKAKENTQKSQANGQKKTNKRFASANAKQKTLEAGAETRARKESLANAKANTTESIQNNINKSAEKRERELDRAVEETYGTRTAKGRNRARTEIQKKLDRGEELTPVERRFIENYPNAKPYGKEKNAQVLAEEGKIYNKAERLADLERSLKKHTKANGVPKRGQKKNVEAIKGSIRALKEEVGEGLTGRAKKIEEMRQDAIAKTVAKETAEDVVKQGDELVNGAEKTSVKTAEDLTEATVKEAPTQPKKVEAPTQTPEQTARLEELQKQNNYHQQKWKEIQDSGGDGRAYYNENIKPIVEEMSAIRKGETPTVKSETPNGEKREYAKLTEEQVADDPAYQSLKEIEERQKKLEEPRNNTPEKVEESKSKGEISETKADELNEEHSYVRSIAENDEGFLRAGESYQKNLEKHIGSTGKLVRKLYERCVDSLHGFENLAREIGDKNISQLIRNKTQRFRMARSMTNNDIMHDFLPIWEKHGLIGKSADIEAKRTDFENYAFLLHDMERHEMGTEFMGYNDADEIQRAIDDIVAKYGEKELNDFQKKVTEYFSRQLDLEVKSGIVSAEDAAKLRKTYPNYVPTFRSGEYDKLGNIPTTHEFGDGTINPVHLYEAQGGTGAPIRQLFEQGVYKTSAVRRRTTENELFSVLGELNGIDPSDIAKLSEKHSAEEIANASFVTTKMDGKYFGMYYQEGKAYRTEISKEMYDGINNMSSREKVAIFDAKLINNSLTKGYSKLWKALITDYSVIFGIRNFARDLPTGFLYSQNGLGYGKQVVFNVGRQSARLVSTLMPKELRSGAMKDIAETYDVLKTAYDRNGGAFGNLISSANADDVLRSNASKSTLKKGVDAAMKPAEAVKSFNTALETFPRMAEFYSTMEEFAIKNLGNGDKKVGKEAWNKLSGKEKRDIFKELVKDDFAVETAVTRSKEATLNFDRHGDIGAKLNSTILPFYNPSVQGLDKLTRVLYRDVKGDKNAMLNAWLKMGIFGVGASGVWNAAMSGNEDYQAISDYQKNTNFCIPIPGSDGDFIKIPKSREAVAIASPMDWLINHAVLHSGGKDEDLFASAKRTVEIAWQNIGPVNIAEDNIFYKPIQIGMNKDWMGYDINKKKDLELKEQGDSNLAFDEDTTRPAQWLADAMNSGMKGLTNLAPMLSEETKKNIVAHGTWTPKQIDQLLDGQLGIVYDMGMKPTAKSERFGTDSLSDIWNDVKKEGAKAPLSALSTIMGSQFGKAFVIDTSLSNNYTTNAYGRKEKYEKIIEKGENDARFQNTPEYREAVAEEKRMSQSFLNQKYAYDNIKADVYLNENYSFAEKKHIVDQVNKFEKELMKECNSGGKYSTSDPMSFAYFLKDKSGKRVFSNDDVIRMCSYETTTKDGEKKNYLQEMYDQYKADNPKDKNAEKFMEVTLDARRLNMGTGDTLGFTDWNTVAYAATSRSLRNGRDYKAVMRAYGISDEYLDQDINNAKKYFEQYDGSMLKFKESNRAVVQAGIDLGVKDMYTSDMKAWDNTIALSTSKNAHGNKFDDSAYYVHGWNELDRMNAGRCLATKKNKDYTWDNKTIYDWTSKEGWSDKRKELPPDEEIVASINKNFSKASDEEKAALFKIINPYTDAKPFGEIGDYSLDSDKGCKYDWNGYGGRRRGRGRGHRRGYGGRSGGGSSATTGTVKTAKVKVSDVTFDSNLNNAYRKKLQKLRDDSEKEAEKINKAK